MDFRKRTRKLIALFTSAFLIGALFPAGFLITALADEPPAPAAWGPTPSPAQLAYQKEEISSMLCYGMNIYTDKEWGTGTETPSQFTAASIDADQWAGVLKGAGFQRTIFVAKHHDGFCLWPSALTSQTVANSPAQIDVMGEFSAACTQYDLDMGFYLSPWDMNSPDYGNARGGDYNEYYIGHLREVLGNPLYGNNGEWVEVWMDGAKGTGQFDQDYYFDDEYTPAGKESWFDVIKSYNPDTVIFSPVGSEVRWNGTESGYSSMPCWNKIKWSEQSNIYKTAGGDNISYTMHGDPDGTEWSVPEADFPLTPGWFDYKGTPKPLKALGDIYFNSVGRSSVMMLSVAPGQDGRISQAQTDRVAEFGAAVRNTFAVNLAANAAAAASDVRGSGASFGADKVTDGDYDTYWTMADGQTTGSVTVDLGEDKIFDVVSLQEYIPLGQRISGYTVEVFSENTWKPFGTAGAGERTIGYKALVRDNVVTASKVRLTITASQAVPLINTIGVYKADEAFEMKLDIPKDAVFIDDRDLTYGNGHWEPGSGVNSINDTHTWSYVAGQTASFTFTGNKFYVIGVTDPGHGTATVTVDGVEVGMADDRSPTRSGRQITYESPYFDYGPHTVVLTTSDRPFDIDGVYYLDVGDVTYYSLASNSYTVKEDVSYLNVAVKRGGDIMAASSVKIFTEPGTGVQGKTFTHISETVNFAANETEKIVPIEILDNKAAQSDKNFYVQLEILNEEGYLSTGRAMVTVLDVVSSYDPKELYDESLELENGSHTFTGPWSGEEFDAGQNNYAAFNTFRTYWGTDGREFYKSSAATTVGFYPADALYVSPGLKSAALTFTAPYKGTYGISPKEGFEQLKFNASYGFWGDPDVPLTFQITVDGVLIPGTACQVTANTPATFPSVPSISMEAGQKLRFEVLYNSAIGDDWGTKVHMRPIVTLTSKEETYGPSSVRTDALRAHNSQTPLFYTAPWSAQASVNSGAAFSNLDHIFVDAWGWADPAEVQLRRSLEPGKNYVGFFPGEGVNQGLYNIPKLYAYYTGEVSALTFTVPSNGVYTIAPDSQITTITAVKDYWADAGMENNSMYFQITKNGTRIWPSDDILSIAPADDPVPFPALSDLQLEQGDVIRFEVHSGNVGWQIGVMFSPVISRTGDIPITPPAALYGDLNADGVVTNSDSEAFQEYLLKKPTAFIDTTNALITEYGSGITAFLTLKELLNT